MSQKEAKRQKLSRKSNNTSRLKQASPNSSQAAMCLREAASALRFPMMAIHLLSAEESVTMGSLFYSERKEIKASGNR